MTTTRPYVMTVKEAQESARISTGNSKMPGTTFAQDSFACKVGDKLAKIEGSVCKSCYARRIQKIRPSVDKGWKANLEKARHWLAVNPTQWIDSCVFQITRSALKTLDPFHRWFDSGDIDSIEQLAAICKVAERTPDIAHWLPTREAGVVKKYLAQGGSIPGNLVLRVSATMVGDSPVRGYANTSTVHVKGKPHTGHACPAPSQGNSCGSAALGNECRACWNPSVRNVSYVKH